MPILGILPLLLGLNPDPLLMPKQIEAWVRDFAPIVVHDSRELAPLTSIKAQLALEPELQGSCADGSRRGIKVRDENFMQQADVQQLLRDCGQETAMHFGRSIPKPENISYYSVVADGLYLKIQYWLYYAWNDTSLLGGGPAVQQCGGHEGDWEHVALRLNRQKLVQATSQAEAFAAIDDIYLAGHGRRAHLEYKRFRRGDRQLHFEANHLLVYPGVGSHASYAAPGRYHLMTLAGMPIADLNDGKGLRMELAQGRLEPVVSQPWFDYPGRWGAIQHDACDSVEALSSASNDGSYGPGHAHKVVELYQGDWQDDLRPLASH
ncbi:MAG TPA: hypothetical protein V6D23_28360 [Candidatus Obscuribacterales bacterium]